MKHTDIAEIRAVLRDYMFSPEKQAAPFLLEIKAKRGVIWNGHVCRGGLSIEGARPFGCATSADGDSLFSLTNSDSNYSLLIGALKLSDIESIETMN